MTKPTYHIEPSGHHDRVAWIITTPDGDQFFCPSTGGIWRGRNYLNQIVGTAQFHAGTDRRRALDRFKRWHKPEDDWS